MREIDPAALAERYFDRMKAADVDGLAALFVENATMAKPDGAELAGRAAIRANYVTLFAAQRPIPRPVAQVVGARAIAFEIDGAMADGTPTRTANFFFFDEVGLIERVSAYRRPVL